MKTDLDDVTGSVSALEGMESSVILTYQQGFEYEFDF
jgi:hypothetical protein